MDNLETEIQETEELISDLRNLLNKAETKLTELQSRLTDSTPTVKLRVLQLVDDEEKES